MARLRTLEEDRCEADLADVDTSAREYERI